MNLDDFYDAMREVFGDKFSEYEFFEEVTINADSPRRMLIVIAKHIAGVEVDDSAYIGNCMAFTERELGLMSAAMILTAKQIRGEM